MWLRRKARYRDIAPLTAGGKRMSQGDYEQWHAGTFGDPAHGQATPEVQDDVSPADWIDPLLTPGSGQVRALVPQGFEDYARIFLPFSVVDPEGDDEEGEEDEMTWAEMAKRHGKVRHALMEAETIAGDAPGEPWSSACFDEFGLDQFDALMPVLARHTSSEHCLGLLWDGHPHLGRRKFGKNRPRVNLQGRGYFLLRGQLMSYDEVDYSPDYWWPEDRAWCLVGDWDLNCCYLAASKDCIDDVVVVPVIDAIRTRPEHPAHKGMDVINDPDGLVPRSP